MKVLKICINEWENASRDKRELSVCRELGADVEVIAKGEITGTKDEVDGYLVTRISTRPLGKRVPISVNRVVSIFTWAAYVRKLQNVDVISGHDYIALLIGYLSNIGKRNKAKLVYDSHEFELGRSGNRNRCVLFVIKTIEKFLIKRCEFSIMVNTAIADKIVNIYKLDQYPVVVRNTPNYWNLDNMKIQTTRRNLLKYCGITGDGFVVMYHGGVVKNRGIEQLIEAVGIVKDVCLVILGDGDPDYTNQLQQLCEKHNIINRVVFHEAVPQCVLSNYVAAADVGVSLLQPTATNHLLALPNKFFENVQSLTPIIVSDFPSVGEIVDYYQIGLKVDPTDPQSIADAIQKLYKDVQLKATFKNNLIQAKHDLCWEKEKGILADAYRSIL